MTPTNFVFWLGGLLSAETHDCGLSSVDTEKIIQTLKNVKTETGYVCILPTEEN